MRLNGPCIFTILFSAAFYIAALCTNYWVVVNNDISETNIHFGLWQMCFTHQTSTLCLDYVNPESFILVSRALTFVALAMVACTVLFDDFYNFYIFFATGGLVMGVASVMQFAMGVENLGFHGYSWGFILATTAPVFHFIGAVYDRFTTPHSVSAQP